ncbi:zinc-ribbon domain-containing protein [bacterium]|nr:zinc-ribbon domain-containing protein [bacterium]
MNVQCPICDKKIPIPDAELSAEGTQVRCPSCEHVTRFFVKDATPPLGLKKPAKGAGSSRHKGKAAKDAPAPPDFPPQDSDTSAPPDVNDETTPAADDTATAAAEIAFGEAESPPAIDESGETDANGRRLVYANPKKVNRWAEPDPPPPSRNGAPPKKRVLTRGVWLALVLIVFLVVAALAAVLLFPVTTGGPGRAPDQPAEKLAPDVLAAQAYQRALELDRMDTAETRLEALSQYHEARRIGGDAYRKADARVAFVNLKTAITEGRNKDSEAVVSACGEAEALDADTKNTREGRIALSACRLARGAFDEATAYARAAAEADEAELAGREDGEAARLRAEALVLLARVFVATGDAKRGQETATHAASVDPSNVGANLVLAKLASDKKKWKEALAHAQAAKNASPAHQQAREAVEHYGDRVKGLVAGGVPGDDKELGTTAEKQRAARERIAKARALREKKANHRAIGELEQALKLCPACADAHLELGWVYYATGRQQAAIASFDAARELGAAQANYGLGKAYQQLGMMELATRAYTAYLETDPPAEHRSDIEAALAAMKE